MSQMGLALHNDALQSIFAKVGFAALCEASYVSRDFRILVDRAIKLLYVVWRTNGAALNYAQILYERDALAQDALNSGVAGGCLLVACSLGGRCVQSILEARFGDCFNKPVPFKLAVFCLRETSVDILIDEHYDLVLPYFLDSTIWRPQWVYFIHRLVDLKRFALLEQLTFAKIDPEQFARLMSCPLPERVVVSAVQALQKHEPTSELSSWLAFAGFGEQMDPLPNHHRAPLFILRYLHERKIPLPEHCVFTGGLAEQSISFWMYVFEQTVEEAEEVLKLVLKHGDEKSKWLANAYYGPVSDDDLMDSEKDIYRAMLVRFHSSPVCNDHVAQNYESMRGPRLEIGYYTACAFLDYGQFQWLGQCDFSIRFEDALEALLQRVHQLQDDNLTPLIQYCVTNLNRAPQLLQRLIRKRANGPFIRAVWGFTRMKPERFTYDQHRCSAPLTVLEYFAFAQDVSPEDAKEIFSMLDGCESQQDEGSKELYALHTAMHWEASEKVITYFFDRVPSGVKLQYLPIWRLVQVEKYSTELCKKLVQRLKQTSVHALTGIWQARPDLFGIAVGRIRCP